MSKQTERMTGALETALQMEVEGKEFYQKTGQKSVSPLVQELFKNLAAQEDVHYRRVQEVHAAVKAGNRWPEKESTFNRPRSLQTVFKDAIEKMGAHFEAPSAEVEALKIAISMEDKSYSFYRNREEEAGSPAEKAFYKALTGEERVHYLTLQSSHEYLSNPEGWFTMKERWSLDGM
jgi:rubrerythrin